MRSTPSRLNVTALTLSAALVAASLQTMAPALPQAQAATALPISQIQGTGASTPYAGQTVTTEPAIVTAVYPSGSGEFGGFVIQKPGSGGNRDLSKGSDALFVYTGTTQSTVKIGDKVQVTGVAAEYNGLTQLSGKIEVTPVTSALPPVVPVTNPWASTVGKRENLESMLYRSSDSFRVSDTYNLGKYGELGLAAGGELPTQPTEVGRPGSAAAAAQAAKNEAISTVLDDGSQKGFAVTSSLPARQVPYATASGRVSVGDQASLKGPVIVDYRYNTWRFQPTTSTGPGTEPASISHTDEARPSVGGAFSIASFNVLNYFTTTGDQKGCAGGNLSTDGTYNVASNCDVRGAYDAADFGRQQAKTVSAINQLDASVVGLMEMENSLKLGEAKDEALANLVTALNKAAGSQKWKYVSVPASELEAVANQDFIQTSMIYQPAKVTQVGTAKALGSQAGPGGAFDNARTPISAVFKSTASSTAKPVTVVINHFKSKGSAPASGADADQGDGQGAWNATRVRQAQAVKDWLPTLTAAAGSEDVAVLGDLNSYSQEDPLQVFYGAGFAEAATGEHTYLFGGQGGSLDHLLVSSSLRTRLTGAGAWNINSVQSPLLQYAQYRTTALDYYQPNQYASSDHDPFIAGFTG